MSEIKYKSEFLNVLSERGFIHQCSDMESLDKKLCEGSQSAYIGYDPTGASLHAGHLFTVMMLYWFQQCGHKPITLMGGATALIPDPTLKDKTRPLLTPEQISSNIEGIKKSFSKFLKYGEGENDAVMLNNYDWFEGVGYIDFLRDIGLHFTINRMLTFESVKSRLDRELPMTFIEFNYMILQGYDFYQINEKYGTLLQMGGSDQWGNMINGVELTRRKTGKELFALTAPLLTTSSGNKMGKTEGGAVWLDADMFSPYEYYQYWRNTDDSDVGKMLRVFTTMPMDEVRRLESLQGQEINEAKKILAFEATKLCHGENAASEALMTAKKVFEQGGLGEALPSFNISGDMSFVDALCHAGLAKSKSEARRIVVQGGGKLNDQAVKSPEHMITSNDANQDGVIKISASKKRHALLKI